ncbi:MAG: hypothetical protein U5R46_16390 [Gammaproteobacteria bacterium]|nr:hypothetical protein [Gammaproteobacteria bacterium]
MTGEELVAALRSFGSLDLQHGGRVLRLYLSARSPGSGGGG